MGVIDEVDSVDFSSTMKSNQNKTSNTPSIVSNANNNNNNQKQQQLYNDNIKKAGKINHDRIQ